MAFIVQRGSWDRTIKIGYRVMAMRIDDTANPPRAINFREFMWGWLQNKNDKVNQYSWGEGHVLTMAVVVVLSFPAVGSRVTMTDTVAE